MASEIPVGRNVGVYVYNGSEWRKLRSDSEGRLLVAGQLAGQQPLASHIRRYAKYSVSIAPGGTYTILDTTLGQGKVFHTYFRADGLTGAAKFSSIVFYVDGEATPSISPDLIYTYLLGGRLVDIGQAGAFRWDETYYIYEVWWGFGPTFQESLKITIVNADSSYSMDARYGIWVEWWV